MNKRGLFVIIILFAVLLNNCTKVYHTDQICFQENIRPIFVSHCAISGCHDPISFEEDYDFSNYSGIMKGIKPKHPAQSEIYKVIKGNHPEEYPQLSAEQINQVKLWILVGAPNSSNCFECDTTIFSYSGRVSRIMENWCTGCHGQTLSEGGIDLSDYSGVATSVSDGTLMGSIEHSYGYAPMPKNAGSLSDCDINAIQKWIDAGYPNN